MWRFDIHKLASKQMSFAHETAEHFATTEKGYLRMRITREQWQQQLSAVKTAGTRPAKQRIESLEGTSFNRAEHVACAVSPHSEQVRAGSGPSQHPHTKHTLPEHHWF